MFGNVLEQNQENGPLAERKEENTKRAREHGKQKRVGDRKGESDSRQGRASTIPSFPSWGEQAGVSLFEHCTTPFCYSVQTLIIYV